MNTFEPTVSVVIPTFNSSRTLHNSVQSVLNQSYPPIEIIIVDNKSTDNTLEVANSVLKDSFIRVSILEQPIKGSGPARNLGIKSASGQLVAFLDADDSWHPNKIEKQLRLHGGEGNIISGTYAKYVGDSGQNIGHSIKFNSNLELNFDVFVNFKLPYLLSSWMISRKDLFRVGLFDEQYIFAQDYDFFYRAMKVGLLPIILPEELLTYRIHTSSSSTRNYINQSLTATYVTKKFTKDEGQLSYFLESNKGFSSFYYRKALSGKLIRCSMSRIRPYQLPAQLLVVILATILYPQGVIGKIKRHKMTPKRQGNLD